MNLLIVRRCDFIVAEEEFVYVTAIRQQFVSFVQEWDILENYVILLGEAKVASLGPISEGRSFVEDGPSYVGVVKITVAQIPNVFREFCGVCLAVVFQGVSGFAQPIFKSKFCKFYC